MTKSETARRMHANSPELSLSEIARRLKMHRSTVQQALQEVRKVPEARTPRHETPFALDVEEAGNAVWQERYRTLLGKYEKAVKETSVVRALVDEVKGLAPKSYHPAPAIKQAPRKDHHTPQSAVLMLSDTHCGQVIDPDQTLGFGGYSFDLFLARLKYVEESVESIIKGHQNAKTDELVVVMLGDILHGALLHSAEAAQRTTLFSQYYNAGHALAQCLRALARAVPLVRVETVVGNHTRWGHQHKMPSHNRFSNLDFFVYSLVQALTSDIKNIRWNLSQQPFAVFDTKGFRFHASHGDHLRGGDKALGIPVHAMARQMSVTTQLFNKNDRQSPHFYLTGHLHRSITLPHSIGSIMVNGGFAGIDGYSLTENFTPVDPTQRFFFVHPRYGKTAEYELSLKFAEVGPKPPYTLPEGFPIE